MTILTAGEEADVWSTSNRNGISCTRRGYSSGTQDLVIDSTCEVRTFEATPSIVCSSTIVPELITQTDGKTKAIFLGVRDLVINRNGVLKLYDGDLALIIGASGKVTIDGRIVASADVYTAVSGGYANAATRQWVRAYVERHKKLPDEARRSWPFPYVVDLIGDQRMPGPQTDLFE